jgi:hypothetical protein
LTNSWMPLLNETHGLNKGIAIVTDADATTTHEDSAPAAKKDIRHVS